MPFHGDTYDASFDKKRLTSLLRRVTVLMRDGRWRTLAEIVAEAGGTEASVSARLRDLRKEKFGSYQIGRRRRGKAVRGLWEYQMPQTTPAPFQGQLGLF